MKPPASTRYQRVSRRALLKASLSAGAVGLVPGLACGNSDVSVLAGALTDLPASPTPLPTLEPVTTLPTLEPSPTLIPEPEPAGATPVEPASAAEVSAAEVSGAEVSAAEVSGATDADALPSSTPEPAAALADAGSRAVVGEMVIGFTYTQGAEGKNESPYVAIWIEDAQGDLATTVSLWYQQERRGERWLDHLTRWYDVDLDHTAAGGTSNSATVSSATRAAGSYAVVWDGNLDGAAAQAGDYFVCIEAVREDGPYSLIREPLLLSGALALTSLPDTGELSAATVQINA